MSRKGSPKDGYNFGNKRQYRRTLWNFVDRCFPDKPNSKRKVMILDTSEAGECKFLITQKGYRPENINVVNRNPAELALLTKRLKDEGIFGINTHKGDAFEILDKLVDSIDVVNLDLTGPIKSKLSNELEAIRLHDELFISVTILRGRESRKEFVPVEFEDEEGIARLNKLNQDVKHPNVQEFLKELEVCGPRVNWNGRHDLIRIIGLFGSAFINGIDRGLNMYGKRWDIYRSSAGSQTMMWFSGFFMQTNLDDKSLRYKQRAISLTAEYSPEILKVESINKMMKIDWRKNDRMHSIKN